MAISRWKAAGAGKWSKASEWTPETVPTASIDAEFTAAASGECKVEAAARQCRQLVMTGFTGTLKLTSFALEIGGSATGGIEANVAARFAGTLSSSGGELVFVSTVTTTAQKIFTGSKTIPWLTKFTSAGKWVLEDNWTQTAEGASLKPEAGTLEGNAKTIETQQFEALGTANVDLSGCTLKLNGINLGWSWGSSGTLTTNASTVFEIGSATRPSSQFGGAGKTYKGTVRLIGKRCKLDNASGQTVETLEVLNKAAEFAEGGQVWKEAAKTIFGSLTFNGKAGELCRIESSVAAKPHLLEKEGKGDYEPANSFVAVKDFTYEGGVLYLPNGTDLGGNTNIKFEAKPGGEVVTGKASGTLLLTGASVGIVRNVVSGKATGTLLLGGSATGIRRSVITGKASGELLLTGSANATLRSVVLGKAAGELLLRGSSQATLRSVTLGHATGTLLLTGRAKAISTATGQKVFLLVIDE